MKLIDHYRQHYGITYTTHLTKQEIKIIELWRTKKKRPPQKGILSKIEDKSNKNSIKQLQTKHSPIQEHKKLFSYESIKDFQPINNWKTDLDGEKFKCCREHRGQAKHLIDQTTGRKYLNDSKGTVRFKCFFLTLGTPFVHSIASIINIAYRVIKLVCMTAFLFTKDEKNSYNFKAKLHDAGMDLLRICNQPIALVGLELAAIYGLFRPYDGRKLYASIERFQYENGILAPCFQPDPKQHLLGGDINEKNAF